MSHHKPPDGIGDSPVGESSTNSGSLRDQLSQRSSWSQVSTSLGGDSQSLLCSESMLSTTPPSDELLKLSQENYTSPPSSSSWKQNDLIHNDCLPHRNSSHKLSYNNVLLVPSSESLIATDKYLAASPTSSEVYVSSGSGSYVTKTTSSSSSLLLLPGVNHSRLEERGNERQPSERRMNTNGYDRSRLTSGSSNPTSSESRPAWLADAAGSTNPSHAAPVAQRTRTEGMLVSRLSSSQEGHLILSSGSQPSPAAASAQAASSRFRPPLTLPEVPAQRIYPNVGQYPSLYTTSTSAPLYSSPMYTLHGQPAHLASVSPYSAFYPQYATAGTYGHGSAALLAGHFPQIESYSAVLASMGSHVQQSQLPPRSPATYLTPGHIPQFAPLASPSAHMNSPGASLQQVQSSSQSASTSQLQDSVKVESSSMKSPKDIRDFEMRGRLTSAPLPGKDSRLHGLSSMGSQLTQGKSSKGRDSSKHSPGAKDLGYKGVPTGKEGSLKHRILTRPPDIQIEESAASDAKGSLATRIKTEVQSPKRTKASASVSHLPTVAEVSCSSPPTVSPGVGGGRSYSQTLPSHLAGYPPPQSSQPHYPPHFMKGSIIQLANGDLKRVEDLQTEDFVNSAEISSDLKIDSSTVVRIQENYDRGTAILSFSVGTHRVQVTVEATMEHPFFVFGQGWSSCNRDRTLQRYGLDCQKLAVGDVCISLTHKDVTSRAAAAELNREQTAEPRKSGKSGSSVRFTTPSRMPPPARVMSLEEGQRQHRLKAEASSEGSSTQASYIGGSSSGVRGERAQSRDSSFLQSYHPENVPPRKRRWSAPDQVSVDTDAPPPSKIGSHSNHGNGDSKSPRTDPPAGTSTTTTTTTT